MFRSVRLHGGAATLLWGYRTAAELRTWTIVKVKEEWILTATIARVDAFVARQAPLLFTAPREHGMWAWPIERLDLGPTTLRATLGQPEQ